MDIENQEKQNREANSSKNNSIAKLLEIMTCITVSVGVFSLIGSILLKYTKYGRALYFDFDIDYFNESSTNTLTFAFVLIVISGIIGSTIGVIYYVVSAKVTPYYKGKKLKKVLYYIISILISLFALMFLIGLLIPSKKLEIMLTLFSVYMGIFTAMTLNAFFVSTSKTNIIATLAIAPVVVMILVASCTVKSEYINASENKDFQIIIDNGQIYAVISQDKDKYSAYKCEIQEPDILTIWEDKHKYFDLQSTNTTLVSFSKINPSKSDPITYSEFLTQYRDEIKQPH